jgi:hypothetical protein
MRLFNRTVPFAPVAAVFFCPAGIGRPVGLAAGEGGGGGAARRKVDGGFESVICYKFGSLLRIFYERQGHYWHVNLLG